MERGWHTGQSKAVCKEKVNLHPLFAKPSACQPSAISKNKKLTA
jgi:hypothetical protein